MAGVIYSDIITTSALPDSMRLIYSNELEFTSRPNLMYDQPAFVEPRNDFAAKRGQQVTWTIYHQIAPSIGPLNENQDIVGGSIEDHQVSFTVTEYGTAIGTSEKIDLLSYHGPIGNIVRSLLAPHQALTMDTLCRNVFWYAPNRALIDSSLVGPAFISYTGPNSTSRYSLDQVQSILSADVPRRIALNLTVRRVPTMSGQEPSYLCLTHPSVTYDLRADPYWKDAQLYAGATKLFNGEEGMIHGVRFIKSDRARIANGGNYIYQTTLTAAYGQGVNQVVVTNASGFSVGQEITLHNTGIAATQGVNSWTAPDGRDPTQEDLVIKSIAGNTLTFNTKTLQAHSAGDFATEAIDVYPMIFVGGLASVGKGTVVPPEVRVSLPTDKLRRLNYVGWYSLMGYGVIRDWAYEIVETCASVNIAPVYGF
jgi:N4-gp56 family major capsid protein